MTRHPLNPTPIMVRVIRTDHSSSDSYWANPQAARTFAEKMREQTTVDQVQGWLGQPNGYLRDHKRGVDYRNLIFWI